MSALTQPVRNKMFGFLKNILRKSGETPVEYTEPAAPEPAPAAAPARAPIRANGPSQRPSLIKNGNGNGSGHAPASGIGTGGQSSGKGVDVSLQAVLSGLPLELQPRIRLLDVGDATLTIPIE